MYCPKCATALGEGAYFCQKCGTNLTPGAPAAPQLQRNSSLAIYSLVAGLLPFFGVTSLAAVVLGHVALSEINHSAGRLKGRGMAMTGLFLGYICMGSFLILIIAAITVPNFMQERVNAHETAAVASLHTLNIAENNYSASHPDKGFTCELEDLRKDNLVQGPLAKGNNLGYVFELSGCKQRGSKNAPNTQFRIIAYPFKANTTGKKAFCSDETLVVRYSDTGSGEDCLDHGKKIGE